MNALIETVTVITELACLIYYCYSILSFPKIKKSHTVIIIILFGCVLSILSILPVNPLLRIFFSIVGTELGCLFVYKETWFKILYVTLIFYALSVLSDIFCSGVLALFGMPINLQMSSALAERSLYIATAKLLHLIGIQIAIAVLNKGKNEILTIQTIPLVIGQVASIFICHQLYLSMKSEASVMAILDITAMLYINIVICYYIESIKRSYANKKEREIAERQLIIQQSYYEQVLMHQEETRSLWHDIKKHLNAMEVIAKGENKDNVASCMKQTRESLDRIHKVIDVGNQIVNGILEYGLNKATQKGIKLELDVWVSSTLNISPIDLYVIMGNTIDNAVEACSHLLDAGKKVIYISLRQKNHLLYYEIKNNMDAENKPKGGSIHGYGLKNVQKCVGKYNGSFFQEINNDMFIVSVQLSV